MSRVLTITLYSKRVAALSSVVFAVSALCYGVLLLLAVEHTAARAKAEAKIKTVSSQLATLETEYLASTKAITPEKAAEMGFVVPEKSATVFADATPRALSFTNGRP